MYTGNDRERLQQFDTAVRRVYRFRDELQELIRTPEMMLDDWQNRGYLEGDCDDIATFGACVITAMGISCRFVSIRTYSDVLDYTHVFLEARMGTMWFRFDPTVKRELVMIGYGDPMVQPV